MLLAKLFGFLIRKLGFFIVIASMFFLPFISKDQDPGTGVYKAFPLPLALVSELSSEYISSYTTLLDEVAEPYREVLRAYRSLRSWGLLVAGMGLAVLASLAGIL